MTIIGNNDLITYAADNLVVAGHADGDDPYTNNNGGTMLRREPNQYQ